MRAAQVVQWTRSPSLAIAADGCVVATNDACDRLLGLPARMATGMRCWEVVRATDASGTLVCSPTDCQTLAALGEGDARDLQWNGWLLDCGTVASLRATALAVPPEERTDGAAAVLFLNIEPQAASTPAAITAPGDVSPPGEACRSGVRVHLLGRPECWNGHEKQRVTRRRVFEVLTLLALSGEMGCSREAIVDTLWPDAPRDNGRQHLRVLLHAIRQALGAGSITTVSQHAGGEGRLRLDPHIWVDLIAFQAGAEAARTAADGRRTGHRDCDGDGDGVGGNEVVDRLEAAIALYRGGLDEFGQFGEWVAPHRERLRAQYLALLAKVAPALARCGRIEDAIAYCQRAVDADPLAEDFQVALLTAYGHLGRRSAALIQYRNYRRTLAQELQIEPSSAVTRAFRQATATRSAGR